LMPLWIRRDRGRERRADPRDDGFGNCRHRPGAIELAITSGGYPAGPSILGLRTELINCRRATARGDAIFEFAAGSFDSRNRNALLDFADSELAWRFSSAEGLTIRTSV
jgi:hypothetical protein